MRLVEMEKFYDPWGKPLRMQEWTSEDGFVFTVDEGDDETDSIKVRDAQGRYCTSCIYKKFVARYDDKHDISYGRSIPPHIQCRREDLKIIMSLIESMDNSRLYFDDTI